MNSSRYIIARLLLSFGWHRKNKRLVEAADEAHLLRQAEEILGEDVWQQTEDIEAISVEYWSLRKLKMDDAKLSDAIEEADLVLNSSHVERNEILTQTNRECQALEQKRSDYIKDSEVLIVQRDQTIAEAKLVKRRYEAARTKIQVLEQGGGNEAVIDAERQKIKSYKHDFSCLKKDRDAVGAKIQVIEDKIAHVEEALGHDRKRLRDEASIAYQSMGKANQDMSKLAAEIGTVESAMKIHFCEIGRFVSHNVGIDSTSTQICKDHAHLVAQIQSLRSSIALNHKLAAMADV
jgi:hypothetical protein